MTRALQVMTDREVTPQLGLLKSTLLQLDSSFSERDYGASSFREFADKLAEAGLVTLRSSGRSVLVDLHEAPGEAGPNASDGQSPPRTLPVPPAVHVPHAPVPAAAPRWTDSLLPQPDVEAEVERRAAADAASQVSFADGVALLRRVLATPGAVQRWPMYIRNVKQILRAAEPSFDERKARQPRGTASRRAA